MLKADFFCYKKLIKAFFTLITIVLILFSNTKYICANIKKTNIIDDSKIYSDNKLYINDDGYKNVVWYVDNIPHLFGSLEFELNESMYESFIKVICEKDGMTMEDQIYYAKIPVLYINTNNVLIDSKENYIDAKFKINGNVFNDNYLNFSGKIKGRGNTTWGWPKKPYKLKLNDHLDLFGLGKNKHWVLLANYIDLSLMRNKIACDISEHLGLENTKSTWVDVILNGEYQGTYLLIEQINISQNRVDIQNIEEIVKDIANKIIKDNKIFINTNDENDFTNYLLEDLCWINKNSLAYKGNVIDISKYFKNRIDLTGGYLFELSEEYDQKTKFMTFDGMKVMVKEPEYTYTNKTMMNYCENLWNDFIEACSSVDGRNKKGVHYTEIADIDSMAKYFLVNEILANEDASQKSRYAYKDINKKLTFGPVWDFDFSTSNIIVLNGNSTGWKIAKSKPFKYWITDFDFCKKLYNIYWKNREYIQSYVKNDGYIDTYYYYLKEAGKANNKKWFFTLLAFGNSANKVTFDKDVKLLKNFLNNRLCWLDQQFKSPEFLYNSLNSSANLINSTFSINNNILIYLSKSHSTDVDLKVFVDGVPISYKMIDKFIIINVTNNTNQIIKIKYGDIVSGFINNIGTGLN